MPAASVSSSLGQASTGLASPPAPRSRGRPGDLRVRRILHDDEVPDAREVLPDGLDEVPEARIHDEDPVLCVIDDVGDVLAESRMFTVWSTMPIKGAAK